MRCRYCHQEIEVDEKVLYWEGRHVFYAPADVDVDDNGQRCFDGGEHVPREPWTPGMYIGAALLVLFIPLALVVWMWTA